MKDRPSWGCDQYWDGVDFTPCMRDRYFANFPFLLIGLFLILVIIRRVYSRYTVPRIRKITTNSLTSPIGDSNLIQLESTVILSAVAANLLPAPPAGESEKITEQDAEVIINDYQMERDKRVEMWKKWKYAAGIVGAILLTGSTVVSCIVQREGWKGVAFPVFILGLSLHPRPPISPLLTLHLIPVLIQLRSDLLGSIHPLDIIPPAVEVLYWIVLVIIPYSDSMKGLFSGTSSKGGGSLGSFGNNLPKHLEEPTSASARATYSFMTSFLLKHYWKALTLNDIPSLREDDSSSSALGAFRADQAYYDALWAEKNLGERRKRNLGLNLFRFFAPEIAMQTFWAILFICLQYLPPTGLRLLLKYVSERETSGIPTHVAYLYVAMMAGGQCFGIVTMAQALMSGRRICNKLRSIIVGEMFAKALRRRDFAGSSKKVIGTDKDGNQIIEETSGANDGKISNLVANDAFNSAEICAYIYYMVSCPFAIIVNSFLLYNTLGLASIAGIIVLLIFLPIGGYVGRRYSEIQKELMSATDERLEAVQEVIGQIKLVKFNAWEDKFFERMMITRDKELSKLAKRFRMSVIYQVLVWGTPVVVTATAFAVHSIVLHQPLTADKAFASLILFNMLRDPLALFQDTLVRLIQAYTSMNRIQEYLDEPDTLKYDQLSRPSSSDDPDIGFKDAVVGYAPKQGIKVDQANSTDAEPFRLGPLSITFPVGQLSIIVGTVGSGKTTLITSLLGETTLLSGKIFMPDDHADRSVIPVDTETGLTDTVAYCSQTPWLVGTSIKENILFGSVYNATRYNEVVDACALRRDFEIFELGDETEVGEKGTTCSGGQKARIALARAFYSSAKTIILDDVLSAVDAQTARHIYVNILQGELSKNRTIILVTHAVSLVAPAATHVVLLEDGRVAAQGAPAELLAKGLLDMHEPDDKSETSSSGRSGETLIADIMAGTQGTAFSAMAVSPAEASSGTQATASPPSGDIIEDDLDGIEGDALDTQKVVDATNALEASEHAENKDAPKDQTSKKLVENESQASGAVGLETYTLYWKSMGKLPFWVLLSTAMIGSQLLQIATNAWIRDWANADSASYMKSNTLLHSSMIKLHSVINQEKMLSIKNVSAFLQGRSVSFYLGVYVLLSFGYILSIAARVGVNFYGSLRASRSLYDRLLRRILGAKMRFFDATPSGRITNRLSRDMFSIDTDAGEILMYFINCILSVLSVLIVILVSTPMFVFALIIISLIYWLVGALYITTNREIKRFDSVTRSPIFISFSEVLVGVATIRSYGDSARFFRKLFDELDQNTRCFWYLWQCNRFLHNCSNITGSLVTVFASIFALQNPSLDAGAIGLSITYALSFTDFVLWIVRMYAAAEMTMNSVERVGEYLDLEVEEEKHLRGVEPPAHWPSKEGSVIVKNLTCKYAPQLDPVLRDVSFEIGPKEKIGICGRTGSGKSTLALSFFRFLHQESGSIIIDGIDTAKLSLTALRSRLTILPQEAQLFSGTVRENLDPFSEHEDSDIWDALTKCGLSSKTPFGSRAPTRPVSRSSSQVDLAKERAKQTEGELRVAVGKNLVKGAVDAMKSDEGDSKVMVVRQDGMEEEIEERVIIRSLEESVAIGGKNFSQGQRQLLALARGLLKLQNSSFLIMDESTANLDHATDQTIQNVLRTGLADIQMLVIAHRLMTVCGLDKILVLDHGQVVEFGTPWELIQADGSFRELVRQSGEEAALIDLARAVHHKRLPKNPK